MRDFFPGTGTEAEWNAAYHRLEDYLRAMHLVNKVRQSQIILQLLPAAAEKHAQDPYRSPTALLMEEADSALERWFVRIIPKEERAVVAGYVALFITNGAEKWPMCFLADEISSEFQQILQETDTRASPDLRISSMVPRPIDVPRVGELLNGSGEETQAGAVLIALVTGSVVIIFIALFLIS